MIYFVRSHEGFIKIGTTTDIVSRLKSLQTASPKRLRVKAILEGSYQTEAELHILFASSRVQGEWFKSTEDIKWFLMAIQDNPDITNIYTLYSISKQMRLRFKAKRLRKKKNYKLGDSIKRICGV